MDLMPGMPLLPDWLRSVWALAMGGVIVVHVWHASALRGQRRWWHIGHTTMAVGMAAMYLLPRMAHPTLYTAGAVLFTAITLAEAVTTFLHRCHEGVLNPLWVSSTTDKLAMTYVLLSPAVRPAGLAYVFILYSGGQALAWALLLWDRAPALRSPIGATSGAALTGPLGSAGRCVGLPAHSTPVTRASLAVMAAGMAYMLSMALM